MSEYQAYQAFIKSKAQLILHAKHLERRQKLLWNLLAAWGKRRENGHSLTRILMITLLEVSEIEFSIEWKWTAIHSSWLKLERFLYMKKKDQKVNEILFQLWNIDGRYSFFPLLQAHFLIALTKCVIIFYSHFQE